MSNMLINDLNCKFDKPSLPLWQSTAVQQPNTETLTVDVNTDVVIVGAGITGLSTAIHLAEQGIKVVVVEAQNIGEGASGQNGGQVIPGLKHSPRKLMKIFGADRGAEIANDAQNSADYTFDMIEHYNMNCSAVRSGWIKACHDQKALDEAIEDANELISLGAPIELLAANEVQKLTGSKTFVGGYVDKRAGSVQPLSYTYELCKVAQSLGVEVYSNTKVDSFNQ
jgi:glycine/D-amino acid oxidase-like deaminating enzyme